MVTYERPREVKIIVERDERGRERKVTAIAGGNNRPGHWDLTVEEANGTTARAPSTATMREVVIAMESMLDRTRNDFRNDYKQSHAVYDKVVSVDNPPAYVGGYAAVQHMIKK